MPYLPGFHIIVGDAARDPHSGKIQGKFASITYVLAGATTLQKNSPVILVGFDNLIKLTSESQLTKFADVVYKAFKPLSLRLRELAVPLLIPMPEAEIVWNMFPSVKLGDKKLGLIRIFRGGGHFEKLSADHLYVAPPI